MTPGLGEKLPNSTRFVHDMPWENLNEISRLPMTITKKSCRQFNNKFGACRFVVLNPYYTIMIRNDRVHDGQSQPHT